MQRTSGTSFTLFLSTVHVHGSRKLCLADFAAVVHASQALLVLQLHLQEVWVTKVASLVTSEKPAHSSAEFLRSGSQETTIRSIGPETRDQLSSS